MPTMSKSELALHLGIDRSQPGRYVARGMPVLQDGRIDLATAQKWISQNVDPNQRRARSIGTRIARATAPSRAAVTPSLTFPDLPAGIVSLAALARTMGIEAAECAIRRGVDVETARGIADDLTIAATRGAIEMISEDHAAPVGYANWSSHPLFTKPPEHRVPMEWDDMLKDVQAELTVKP